MFEIVSPGKSSSRYSQAGWDLAGPLTELSIALVTDVATIWCHDNIELCESLETRKPKCKNINLSF